MNKKKWDHVFDFDLDTLVNARAARYENAEWWPEIKDSKVEKQDDDGTVLHIIRRVFMKTNLPKIAEKVIPGGAFEVIEETWYNREKKELIIKANMVQFKKVVQFDENDKYIELPDGKSKRFVEISFNVSVPLIGGTIEKLVVAEFQKQSDKDRDVINNYVASLKK